MLHPGTPEEGPDFFGLSAGQSRVRHEDVGVAKALLDKLRGFLGFVRQVGYFQGVVDLAGELALDYKCAAKAVLSRGTPRARECAIPPAIVRVEKRLDCLSSLLSS